MNKEHFKLYVIAEMNYINKFTNYYEELFPDDWFTIKDYKLKIKILLNCIKNNILIKDSELYIQIKENESHKKM
jgi:hypothetical protein